MKSIKCPECNLVNWENAEMCTRCCYGFASFDDSNQNEDYSQESYVEGQNNYFENQEGFDNGVAEQDDFNSQNQSFVEDQNDHSNYQPNEQFPENHFQDEHYQDEYAQQQQFHENQNQTHQEKSFSPTKPKIKMAVASMVFGILGFPLFWAVWAAIVIGFLAAMFGMPGAVIGAVLTFSVIPISLITGILSLIKTSKFPKEYGGKPFAITGVVCSSLGILLIPIIAALAMPGLLAANKSAKESSTIASIRQISEAQVKYMSSNGGRCGSLEQLTQQKMINKELSKGEKLGYLYVIVNLPSENGGCEILATPISKSEGSTSFYYSTVENAIRAEEKNGEVADANSPPLGTLENSSRPQISNNY